MADTVSNDGLPLTPLYVNGVHRPASTEAVFSVINSYTGQAIGHCASASSSDCNEAVEAAHRAFPAWESAPLAFRRDVLLKTADIMESDEWKTRAMKALREETSSTEGWALYNILPAPGALRNVAGMINEASVRELFIFARDGLCLYTLAQGRYLSLCEYRWEGIRPEERTWCRVLFVPPYKFVCRHCSCDVLLVSSFSISPWNAPVPLTSKCLIPLHCTWKHSHDFLLLARAVAIPLVCGNTVVCRPSEYSPRIIGLMIDAYHQVSSHLVLPCHLIDGG